MAQWETCRIKYVFVRDAGFFGPPICRWEAEIMAPSGSKVIY
jgi:hypothetical protein